MKTILLVCAAALTCAGCASTKNTMVDDLLRDAKAALAPDSRTAVFDVAATLDGRVLTLTGEVHDAALKEALFRRFREQGGYEIVDSVTALPEESLGDRTLAVVSVSVANLRTKPDHAAEMGTQALLGTPLKVLKKKGGWLYVQTPDDYLGWTGDIVARMSPREFAAWEALPKVIITAAYGFSRSEPDEAAQPVSDIVAACILALKGESGDYYEVGYPDGRTAWVARSQAERYGEWLSRARATPDSVVATARRFFGVPYLWGGTSAKGLDCSGFTKTVFFLNGILLPRDASQQVLVGDPVTPDSDMANIRAGDLLFFGSPAREGRKERVTHVGISLGGPRFIHEADDVHINSLDPDAPDFSEFRRDSFLHVRRIIGAGESSGIRFLSQMPYYRAHAF